MKPVYHPNIPAELSQIKPLGDLVLVRRIVEQERSNIIIAPGWRNKGVDGVKTGEVIAVGPGDKGIWLYCLECHEGLLGFPVMQGRADGSVYWKLRSRCPTCGGPREVGYVGSTLRTGRADMHVKPGDVVLYHRAPANNFVLNGQDYVMLREEQHVLAVIESKQEAA